MSGGRGLRFPPTVASARIVLAASVLVALGLAAAWAMSGPDEARADLRGTAVTVESRSSGISPPAPVPTQAPIDAPLAPAPPPIGIPQLISIPSLDVVAPVVPVGLEDDGSMEIPGATEAGWYQFGARPGEAQGSAVVAAHIDFNGTKGVFFDLVKLGVGAQVDVADQFGTRHTFVVTERFQVGKAELPIDELFRSAGAPTLTLITCGGGFDKRARSYDDNIVIRAVPV